MNANQYDIDNNEKEEEPVDNLKSAETVVFAGKQTTRQQSKCRPAEVKSFHGEVKSISGDGNRLIGYASVVGNKDRTGEVVSPGAFKNITSLTKEGVVLIGHDWSMLPVATIDKASVDNEGLIIEAEFLSTQAAQEAKTVVKEMLDRGKSVGLSIGYKVIDDHYKGSVRYLDEIEIYEVSIVPIPANPKARVTGVKSTPTYKDYDVVDISWDRDEAIARWREYTDSTEEPSEEYRLGFFWYDEENTDNFGSYKLPFVTVVNGQPVAVRQAIIGAAAAIQGARGGVDIPDRDVDDVKRHISRYYSKLDMIPPWDQDSSDSESNRQTSRQTSFRLKDHVSHVIQQIDDLVVRIAGLKELRRKEHKGLSPATVSYLKELCEASQPFFSMLEDDREYKNAQAKLAELRARYQSSQSKNSDTSTNIAYSTNVDSNTEVE